MTLLQIFYPALCVIIVAGFSYFIGKHRERVAWNVLLADGRLVRANGQRVPFPKGWDKV